MSVPPVRVQKRIAESGIYSRREAEELIRSGRVQINGEFVTEMGRKVSSEDEIWVDGKALISHQKITIALNKPKAVTSTRLDLHAKETLMDLLPPELHHLKPVGRLDQNSEGLILMSNDGDLIQKLSHPRFGHKKVYDVQVKGEIKARDLIQFQTGSFVLDEYPLKAMEMSIKKISPSSSWLQITLSEGRKRQIRRCMEAIGHPVLYLQRVQIGQLKLGTLSPGQYRILDHQDLQLALQ